MIEKLIEIKNYITEFVDYYTYLTIVIVIKIFTICCSLNISSNMLFFLVLVAAILDLQLSRTC